MARSADALHRRLRQFCRDQATFVDSLLYCPDYTVKQPGAFARIEVALNQLSRPIP